MRVRRASAGLLEREQKTQPTIQKHFRTRQHIQVEQLKSTYVSPLQKQMMLSEHFSRAPTPD
jgi:hypothetical protein